MRRLSRLWGFLGSIISFVQDVGLWYWDLLHTRRFWIISSFGLGVGSAIWYREALFLWLIIPAGGQLSPFDGLPIITQPSGPIRATVSLALKLGVIATLPALWVVALKMLKPRIPRHYWRFIVVYTLVAQALFVAGAAFAYYSLMPAGLGFMLRFAGDAVVPMIVLPEYIGMLTSLMFWAGIIFEIPSVMFLLSTIGLISYRRFKMLRKFWYSASFIFAWLLSPGADLVVALMLLVPMLLLYEVGMLVSWLARPELGNYLWLGTMGRGLRKVWDGIVWVVRRPVVAWRRGERKLVEHGLVPWW